MAELPSATATTFTRHPTHEQKIANDRSDKDEATALEVLRLVVELHKGKEPPTADQLARYAETCWRWVTTDQWPPSTP